MLHQIEIVHSILLKKLTLFDCHLLQFILHFVLVGINYQRFKIKLKFQYVSKQLNLFELQVLQMTYNSYRNRFKGGRDKKMEVRHHGFILCFIFIGPLTTEFIGQENN